MNCPVRNVMLSVLLILLQYRFYISKITSKCCADTTYITKEFCQDWSKRVKPQRHLDCQPDVLQCSDGLTHTVSFNVSSVSANVAFHQKSDITLTLQCSPTCPHMTVTDVRSCKWLVFYGGDDFVGLMAPLVSPHHADWSKTHRVCSSCSDMGERRPVPQRYHSTCCFQVSGHLIVNDLPKGQLDVAWVSN